MNFLGIPRIPFTQIHELLRTCHYLQECQGYPPSPPLRFFLPVLVVSLCPSVCWGRVYP